VIAGYDESMEALEASATKLRVRKKMKEEQRIFTKLKKGGTIMLHTSLESVEEEEQRNRAIRELVNKVSGKLEGDRIDIKEEGLVYVERKGKKCMIENCRKRVSIGSKYCAAHGGDFYGDLVKEGQVPTCMMDVRYDAGLHPMKYITLSRDGLSDVEIAAEFEVSLRTLKLWSETYEEFNTAYEIGKALHESWFLTTGRENLGNARFNTPLFKFLTGNKLGYAEKIENKNLNVHAGVLVVPGQIGEKEWEDSI
jgi:hypothetical protein